MEGRFRGEGVAVMSASYQGSLHGREPVKICTSPGCVGMMRFHPCQRVSAEAHTLEWFWHATWVCEANPAHIEIATSLEEKVLAALGGADDD